jgi:aminotransferase
MSNSYQICTRCVMDNVMQKISFDADGICNYCHEFENVTCKSWFPNEIGRGKLEALIDKVKSDGQGKQYNCILGLSGGVDSSYLALKASEWGLRPLVVHVDAGWNSELAVANIEAIVKHCNYDLHTHVVDWEEMRDLQLAYLKAAVGNQDVPQDHAFFANLYHFAVSNGVRYVLNGTNIATEGISPVVDFGPAMDAINLRAIHRAYGNLPLTNYRTVSFFDYYAWYPLVKRFRSISPLNYMQYDKAIAIEELETKIGWKAYGRKHGESFFTRFFQNYYLPEKFGYDKRTLHLSSLIVSGQMSRDEAVALLKEPLYDPDELESDIEFFCKKMKITRAELNELMSAPNRHYGEFQNWNTRYRNFKKVQSLASRVLGRKIANYS